MLQVQGTLPPPGASDVATREVTVNVTNPDGTVLPADVKTIPVAQAAFTFSVLAGAVVSCSLVDIDGSGNRSPASVSGPFTAADTFPPPMPGAIGFAVVGQDP